MENFNSYFLKERRIFLENISYETISHTKKSPVGRLGCKDSVVSQLLLPAGIKIIFNRRLSFEPEDLFVLSVSFGVIMPFDPAKAGEVDWKNVNIVEEFTKHCPALLANLNARTTLLVAQITSAAGGSPIIPIHTRPSDDGMKNSDSELSGYDDNSKFD